MVELGDIAPSPEVVTTHAAGGRGGWLGRKTGAELPAVGILAAGLAGKSAELVSDFRGMLRTFRVAIVAGHGGMSAGQRKARFGVCGQGESGWAEPIDGVTVLTGRVCELGFVRVAVAIRTELVGHPVFRGCAGGLMTGSAGHRRVPTG